MTSVPVNPGTGNPNARAVVNSPEAAASGSRVAPAPPGQLPYMYDKCGFLKKDGTVCVRKRVRNHDACLGHLKKVASG